MKNVLILFSVLLCLTRGIGAGLGGLSDIGRKAQRQMQNKVKQQAQGGYNQRYGNKVDDHHIHVPKHGEITDEDVQEIEADEEITDTLTIEDDPKLTDEQLHKQWAENMMDFVPDDLSTFIVKGSHAATVYEDIMHQSPTTIKGAYYTSDGEGKYINLFIMDPNSEVIWKRSGEIQGIVIFETTVPGKYTFIFSNLDDWKDRTVTFALHTYQDRDDEIQYEIDDSGDIFVKNDPKKKSSSQEVFEELDLADDADVRTVRKFLRDAENSAKSIITEVKMSLDRQDSHNHDI